MINMTIIKKAFGMRRNPCQRWRIIRRQWAVFNSRSASSNVCVKCKRFEGSAASTATSLRPQSSVCSFNKTVGSSWWCRLRLATYNQQQCSPSKQMYRKTRVTHQNFDYAISTCPVWMPVLCSIFSQGFFHPWRHRPLNGPVRHLQVTPGTTPRHYRAEYMSAEHTRACACSW